MKILEFDYIDTKSEKTHRVALPISVPSNNYLTIDLTDIDEEARESFIMSYSKLQEQFEIDRKNLLDYFGCNKYRAFKKESMSNVIDHNF